MMMQTMGMGMTLFMTGILGIILNSKNMMMMLMSMELMLLAMNFNLMVFSVLLDDSMGQILAMWVLTVAAAESSMGLALLVSYYSVSGSIGVLNINLLSG